MDDNENENENDDETLSAASAPHPVRALPPVGAARDITSQLSREAFDFVAFVQGLNSKLEPAPTYGPVEPRVGVPLELVELPGYPDAVATFERAVEHLDRVDVPTAWPRRVTWCPSCCRNRPTDPVSGSAAGADMLVYASAPGDLYAACLAGCTIADIARGIVLDIATYEAEFAAAQERARADMEAKLLAELRCSPDAIAGRSWLVPGVVPAHALTLLVGESGCGKTMLAYHVALCVASGRPYLQRPVTQGRVLIVQQEAKAINISRLAPLAAGLGLEWTEDLIDVYPWPLKADDDDEESMRALAGVIRFRRYALIVIDNLSEIRSSRAQSSENDATAMGEAMRPLAHLAHDGTIGGELVTDDAPAILLLHHAGKDGSMRGTTAIQQHADLVLEARRDSQREPASPIRVSISAGSRLAVSEEPVALRFVGVLPEPIVPQPLGKTAPAPTPQDPQRARMLEILATPRKANELYAELGGRRTNAIKLRDALRVEGLIEQRDGLWQRVDGDGARGTS